MYLDMLELLLSQSILGTGNSFQIIAENLRPSQITLEQPLVCCRRVLSQYHFTLLLLYIIFQALQLEAILKRLKRVAKAECISFELNQRDVQTKCRETLYVPNLLKIVDLIVQPTCQKGGTI